MRVSKSPFSIGSNGFDAINFELTFGTGNDQGNQWWMDERTLANGANDDLDLAGSLTSDFGETITFTTIKLIIIAIDSPDGTKFVSVGPLAQANAWAAMFGDASDGIKVYNFLINGDTKAGFAVTAGTGDKLRIANSSGVSVTYRILLVGVGT